MITINEKSLKQLERFKRAMESDDYIMDDALYATDGNFEEAENVVEMVVDALNIYITVQRKHLSGNAIEIKSKLT